MPGRSSMPSGAGALWQHESWQIRANLLPGESNAAALAALRNGADALGLTADAQCDLDALLQTVPLSQVALHFYGGDPALLRQLETTATRAGVTNARLCGTFGPDAAQDLKALPAVVALTRAADPDAWRTVRIDARSFHGAGATLTAELGLTIAALISLFGRLRHAGVAADTIAQHCFVDLCVGTSYLAEIAKLRALRHLASKVMAAHGVAPVPLFVHAETSTRAWSAFDPAMNMVRAGSQAMSAITGGCDALSVPLGAPLVAVHMQRILRHEALLGRVADPAAGSWYLEALTDELGRRAWHMAQEIEREGGFESFKQNGRLAAMLRASQNRLLAAAATGHMPLVGVNIYPAPVAPVPATLVAPGSRATEGFERARRLAQELAARLERPVAWRLAQTSALPAALLALVHKALGAGGLVTASEHGDILVVGDGDAHLPLPNAHVIVTVTEEPDGRDLNLWPGCNMVRALERVLSRLSDRLATPHAHHAS